MDKAYNEIVFHNDQSPDLDEINMNAISHGLSVVDDRVIQLKGDLTELNKIIDGVSVGDVVTQGTKTENGYYNGNGAWIGNSKYNYYRIEGAFSGIFKIENSTTIDFVINFYDANNNIYFNKVISHGTNEIIEIPSQCSAIGCGIDKTLTSYFITNYVYPISNIKADMVLDNNNLLYNGAIFTSFNMLIDRKGGYYNGNNVWIGNNSYITLVADIKESSNVRVTLDNAGDTVIQMVKGSAIVSSEIHSNGTYNFVTRGANRVRLGIPTASIKKFSVVRYNDTFNRWRGRTIDFIGDSIVYGIGANTTVDGVTMNTSGYMLKLSEINTNNYGISGSTISDFVNQNPMVNRFNSMSTSCDAVVIWGGTNDFWFNVPMGETYSNGKTLNMNTKTFKGALNYLLDGIQKKFPNVPIIIMTPMHRNPTSQYTDREPNTENLYLSDYVNAIKEIAEIYGIRILDMYASSGINPYNTEDMTDGLHPSSKGYYKVAKLLTAFLDTVYPIDYLEWRHWFDN